MLKTGSSDVLLRPDIALLLPLLTASHPVLSLLSTALLPLKWASGCDCFTALCKRKTTSRRHSCLILVFLAFTHLRSTVIPLWVPILIALSTLESLDTKVLKFVMLLAGRNLPYGVFFAAAVFLTYLKFAGYHIRIADSYELLLSNDDWLLTRDARLAKRVNHSGEFHVEVVQDGRARLMGDGRLVSSAKDISEIPVENIDDMNMGVVRQAVGKGRATVVEGVVKFARE